MYHYTICKNQYFVSCGFAKFPAKVCDHTPGGHMYEGANRSRLSRQTDRRMDNSSAK